MTAPSPVKGLLAAVFLPALAFAAPIAITNPGFEDISGESPFNEFTFGPLSGWDLYDPGNITSGGAGATFFIGTLTPFYDDTLEEFRFFPSGAPEGQRVGIAFNFEGSGGNGEYGLQQTLGATLQANTLYTLQVEIGNIASGLALNNVYYDLNGFPRYRIDLMAGNTILASDNNTLAGSIAEGTFATSTVTFQTGGSHALLDENLTIRLVNLNVIDDDHPDDDHPDADLEVDFDNVRLTADTVPEPGTAALLGLGAALLLNSARRSRRS